MEAQGGKIGVVAVVGVGNNSLMAGCLLGREWQRETELFRVMFSFLLFFNLISIFLEKLRHMA